MGEHWIRNIILKSKIKSRDSIDRTRSWFNKNKIGLLKGMVATAGAVGLFAGIVWSGNYYVSINTNEVYHVYVESEEVGTVTDPKVIEKFILGKVKKLEEEYPHVNMLLNAEVITYEHEKAFMIESDNESVLEKLDSLLVAKAIGVEIRIDGNLVGIVKDQETADHIFEQIQEKYIPQKQVKGQVGILSLDEDEQSKSQFEIEEVSFIEEVFTGQVDTNPDQISEADEIISMLELGDTKPAKYIVVQGDCINCIAKRFEVNPETIYENNNLDENSVLKIGDELDLTVIKPALSVKTVERHQEMLNVHFDTEIEYDPKVKVGNNTVIRQGVEGKKLATYLITKINGYWDHDELIDEQILEEPISQIVRRGTLVIKGEGTGSFAMPVKNARVSSSYGLRWGRLHAGTDFTSSNRDIFASDNGTVITAGWHNSYGNYVIIDHKNGFRTLYAHLSKFNTTKGKVVEKGEKIGVMGSTGNSTGVHLHFEIIKNGNQVNPSGYLKR